MTNEDNSVIFASNKWLIDKEVEFALSNIKQQFPNQHAFISVYEWPLLKSNTDIEANARLLTELTNTEKELIFIPINNPNLHWSLLIYEIKTNKFYHLDSSRHKLNNEYIKDVVNHLSLHKNATFKELDVPYQPNSHDCGIYLITYVKLLSANPELLSTKFPNIDSIKERNYWRDLINIGKESKDENNQYEIYQKNIENNDGFVICDNCDKEILKGKAYFSDRNENVDFCSYKCQIEEENKNVFEIIEKLEKDRRKKEIKIKKSEESDFWIPTTLISAQEYINKYYPEKESDYNEKIFKWKDDENCYTEIPWKRREEIEFLEIMSKDLSLFISFKKTFISLRSLNISGNYIKYLNLKNCRNLEILKCYSNWQLKEIYLDNCDNLKEIDCSQTIISNFNFLKGFEGDKLKKLNCSNCNINDKISKIKKLKNIESLSIYNDGYGKNIYNKFHGSLESLKFLTKLNYLNIKNTDFNSGVNYLPEDLIEINYSCKEREWSKIKEIKQELDDFIHNNIIKKLERKIEIIPFSEFSDFKEIGKGGYGIIHRAKRGDNSQFVALKTFKSNNKKAEILKELINHTSLDRTRLNSISKCYGITKSLTDEFSLVMEYYEHGDLRNYLLKNKNSSTIDRINILISIFSPLEWIHKLSIVHGDLHLGNILVSEDSSKFPHVVIADLGLSNLESKKKENKLFGVLSYTAPELIKGNNITKKSDIYSLGMMAYEILTGVEPYHNYDLTEEELIEEIIENDLRPDFHDGFLIPKSLEYLENNFEGFLVPKFLQELIKNWTDNDDKKRMDFENPIKLGWIPDQEEIEFSEEYNKNLLKIRKENISNSQENIRFPHSKSIKSKYFTAQQEILEDNFQSLIIEKKSDWKIII